MKSLIAVGLFLTTSGFTQEPPRKISSIRAVVKQSGWVIPGLSTSRITTDRRLLREGYGVPKVPMHVTILRPQREVLATIPLFGIEPGGTTLVVGERRGVVQIIIKCDINHRVFAYIVQFVAIIRESNGRVGYSGIYGAQYFDNDADGIFESYEAGAPFVTKNLPIPGWVRSDN